MARVIDYAWGRPSYASLKAAGAIAVCRYLSWLPNGKCLSRAEADGLRANGIDVVSNWEYYGDWEHDYSGGYDSGRAHAIEAARQHTANGGPPGRPIYFSTDFQASSAQLATVADYYHGVASVIGIDRTGAYGGFGTIKYLFDRGVIRWGWQTYAWSGQPTQWDSRAQLRQIRNSVPVGGVDCDLNDTVAADVGQWAKTSTPGGEFMANASEIIIAWSQGLAKTADGTAVSPTVWRIRDEAWQANIVRTVDGLRAAAETRDAATQAAVKALSDVITTGGGDIETAAVLEAIRAASERAETTAQELHDELAKVRQEADDLRRRLAEALAKTEQPS